MDYTVLYEISKIVGIFLAFAVPLYIAVKVMSHNQEIVDRHTTKVVEPVERQQETLVEYDPGDWTGRRENDNKYG